MAGEKDIWNIMRKKYYFVQIAFCQKKTGVFSKEKYGKFFFGKYVRNSMK